MESTDTHPKAVRGQAGDRLVAQLGRTVSGSDVAVPGAQNLVAEPWHTDMGVVSGRARGSSSG